MKSIQYCIGIVLSSIVFIFILYFPQLQEQLQLHDTQISVRFLNFFKGFKSFHIYLALLFFWFCVYCCLLNQIINK